MDELTEQLITVDEIYETLAQHVGEPMKVRANMGRSKIIVRDGVLTQAHPSLFIVEVNEKRGRKARQSYQYVDILTGVVELFFMETGEPFFPVLHVQEEE